MPLKLDRQTLGMLAEGAKGAGAGVGVKYLWEAFQGPGYNIPVGPALPGPRGPWTFGIDEVLQAVIGAGVAGYGAYVKNKEMIAGGLGFIGGEALVKTIEVLLGVYIAHQPSTPTARSVSNGRNSAYVPPVSSITYGAQSTQTPYGQQSPATRGRF